MPDKLATAIELLERLLKIDDENSITDKYAEEGGYKSEELNQLITEIETFLKVNQSDSLQ